MWNGKTVSVALPTYNEKETIRACIDAFFATGVVDEIVVCNNNAMAGTSEQVATTAAREVFESRQGYGWSCRKALSETRGDLVILSEPDGTFEADDIFKLLAYSSDFDAVLGSRTNRELIWTGANMGWFMKWGNWAVAKYLELLFNTTTLTDVGCTMRLFSRPVLERIQPFFTVGGSHFGPEMALLCVWSGAKIVEVPLNYKSRVGKSMATGNRWAAFRVGLKMIAMITQFRIRTLAGCGPHMERSKFLDPRSKPTESHKLAN
jgi:glycosyltransferase involved in cell wall biosynthesis